MAVVIATRWVVGLILAVLLVLTVIAVLLVIGESDRLDRCEGSRVEVQSNEWTLCVPEEGR